MDSMDRTLAVRRVLLFDGDSKRREGRADQLRSRGAEVMCAADAVEARLMFRENSYRLVLVDASNSPDAVAFGKEVRSSKPKQLMAFFVAGPVYLSDSPVSDPHLSDVNFSRGELRERIDHACQLLTRRNGFQEATLRMLAARFEKRSAGGFPSDPRKEPKDG